MRTIVSHRSMHHLFLAMSKLLSPQDRRGRLTTRPRSSSKDNL